MNDLPWGIYYLCSQASTGRGATRVFRRKRHTQSRASSRRRSVGEAEPFSRVGSTLKCPVFIAHDLSGFAFPSTLTEGARRATEVSAENRRPPSSYPLFGSGSLALLPRRHPSAEKAATRCGP